MSHVRYAALSAASVTQVSQTSTIEYEALTSVSNTSTIEYQAEEAVSNTSTIEYEALTSVSNTSTVEYEALNSAANTSTLEYQAEEAVSNTSTIEYQAEEAVSNTSTIEYDSQQPSPVITSLSDNTLTAGESLTIFGTSFKAVQGTSTVDINGVAQTVNNWSDTEITINTVDITGIPNGSYYVRVDVN